MSGRCDRQPRELQEPGGLTWGRPSPGACAGREPRPGTPGRGGGTDDDALCLLEDPHLCNSLQLPQGPPWGAQRDPEQPLVRAAGTRLCSGGPRGAPFLPQARLLASAPEWSRESEGGE